MKKARFGEVDDPTSDVVSMLYRGVDRQAVASLTAWTTMAKAAFSPNTIRAWRADWEIFSAA
jgi:hypothetical protein